MLKFYSDVTRQLYDTKDLAEKAEAEVKKAEAERINAEKLKKEARAKKAKEVEDALKVANEAQAKAIKLLKDFTREYGYFHTSYTIEDTEKKDASSFFDLLADFLG